MYGSGGFLALYMIVSICNDNSSARTVSISMFQSHLSNTKQSKLVQIEIMIDFFFPQSVDKAGVILWLKELKEKKGT